MFSLFSTLLEQNETEEIINGHPLFQVENKENIGIKCKLLIIKHHQHFGKANNLQMEM